MEILTSNNTHFENWQTIIGFHTHTHIHLTGSKCEGVKFQSDEHQKYMNDEYKNLRFMRKLGVVWKKR